MAVPKVPSLFLPLLRIASDGQEHRLKEAGAVLAAEFNLTAADREQRLPSGRQTTWTNRVAWAKVYLGQAGLLRTTRPGHFEISDRGREVLAAAPARIDVRFLWQFPEFVEFKTRTRQDRSRVTTAPSEINAETPEEMLEDVDLRMRVTLEAEVLTRIKAGTPEFFERLVIDLLVKMGYGGSRHDAGERVGRAGDEGIDGVISEDRLGLDKVYIQAKRWEGTVGRPEVQKFVGALQGRRASKGVLITTGAFSKDACSYVDHIDPRVVLIDGRRLSGLMIDFDLGVTTVRSFHVKRIDSDYFEDE